MTEQKRNRGFFHLGRHWPLVIVLMLLAHAGLMIGTIVYVGGKRDTYVDPDYYAKAVDWDNQRKMKEAADREGWSVDLRARFVDDEPHQRRVELKLTDAQGEPIDDARIEMVCFHPVRLSERLEAVLVPDGEGVYARTLPIDRPGIWVAELTIQRRGVRALLTRDLDVVSVPITATP